MKLIVSTFLVYKVKKCLLKQEKSVHQMVPLCPSGGVLSWKKLTGYKST